MHAKVTINVYINTPINPTKNTCPFANFCLHCLHLSPFTPVVCKSGSTFEGLIKSSPYPLYFLRSIEPETKKKITPILPNLNTTLFMHDPNISWFFAPKIWHLGKCNYMYIYLLNVLMTINFKLIWEICNLERHFFNRL